jgi:hypothetical protein
MVFGELGIKHVVCNIDVICINQLLVDVCDFFSSTCCVSQMRIIQSFHYRLFKFNYMGQ